jgi:hypothetical protein
VDVKEVESDYFVIHFDNFNQNKFALILRRTSGFVLFGQIQGSQIVLDEQTILFDNVKDVSTWYTLCKKNFIWSPFTHKNSLGGPRKFFSNDAPIFWEFTSTFLVWLHEI